MDNSDALQQRIDRLGIIAPRLVAKVDQERLKVALISADTLMRIKRVPDEHLDELVTLWAAHTINMEVSKDKSAIKINNVQVNYSDNTVTDPWLVDFNTLFEALGLGKASVTGF